MYPLVAQGNLNVAAHVKLAETEKCDTVSVQGMIGMSF